MAPRVLKDPELRSARDDFKLAKFYKDTSDERRNNWFRALDHAWGLQHLLFNEDPLPDTLVELLASSLREDEALGAFIKDRTTVEWRGKGENWRLVERALAGVIVQNYLSACNDGWWTRTTND